MREERVKRKNNTANDNYEAWLCKTCAQAMIRPISGTLTSVKMRIILLCLLSFNGHNFLYSQGFDNLEFDSDTIIGIVTWTCTDKYGHHMVDYCNLNPDDSLRCLRTSYYKLNNSDSLLIVERNWSGDTMGMGFGIIQRNRDIRLLFKRPIFNCKIESYVPSGYWEYYDGEGNILQKCILIGGFKENCDDANK